jgi:carbonic anhydrase
MKPAPTPTPAAPEETAAPAPEEEAHSLPEWSYEGETGPEHWGDLSEVCAPCAEGLEQSPIDLTGSEEVDLENPLFAYSPSKISVVNNGHTIQVNIDPGSAIELDGDRYELLQFHLHTPSEHTIDGKPYQGEMHFVHRNAAGELAVVALMITRGTKNDALAGIFALIPSDEGMELDIEGEAMIEGLLPEDRRAFRYDGSLTTPPCTEGVKWVVLKQPMGVAIAQWKPFEELLSGNNRPIQPLNERAVQLDTTP